MVIKENILIYSPVLFVDIMDELIEKRKYKNRSDFANEAFKRMLETEGINLTPIDLTERRENELAWQKEVNEY